MARANTQSTYGSVAKTLHWLTVLLILTVIPLGIIANGTPFDTGDALERKALLFSLHKTVGVTLFFVAITRILWAVTQVKPGLLNADKPLESWLAETVHWTLYTSLVIVPLSGWVHHAATTGFAPIWWPFGQNLFFVPKSVPIAETFAGLHIIFERVLVVSLLLHIAGALKHHFIDQDATLRRMLPGTPTLPNVTSHRTALPPIGTAIAAYIVAIGIGTGLGVFAHSSSATEIAKLQATPSGWIVNDGTIGITVKQLGSDVQGEFAEWVAAIEFSDTATDGSHGSAEVTIAIGSLTLGSVTGQAMGADYFDAAAFPTATFTANLVPDGDAYAAEGTLTLKAATIPVRFPFDLTIDGDTATMSAQTTLARLDYDIGANQNESSLGLSVVVDIALTANRSVN